MSDTMPQTCEPLHDLLGYDLCSEFMTMYDVHLSNGHTVRVFKHRWTREYVHLDATEPGLAYDYRGSKRYCPVPLGAALLRAFRIPEPANQLCDDFGDLADLPDSVTRLSAY